MALKETMHELQHLITAMHHDLAKAFKGNKAASQRVRTASVLFTKLSKVFRKESMNTEGKKQKRPSKKKR